MLLRSCAKFVFFFCLLFLIVPSRGEKRKFNFAGESIVKNVPQRRALDGYLKHLELIVRFCMTHRNLIDLNLYFGLFLVNVNLENVILYKQKNIPMNARVKITEILNNNHKLLENFKFQLGKDQNPKNAKDKMIFTLFANSSKWVERLRKFPTVIAKHMQFQTPEELVKTYSEWERYVKKIDNVADWKPQPELSDHCLAELAKYVPKQKSPATIPKCKFQSEKCYDMLVNGSDFGYALSHRLLLIILARLGRGCSIFEPAMDRELTKRFCATAFSEAEYIAMHGFKAVDLILEQMSLCALDGHTEFLSQSWIDLLLRFQTSHGCFYQKQYPKNSLRMLTMWKLSRKNPFILKGHCNSHVTGVAAATLSAVCRLLILTYY